MHAVRRSLVEEQSRLAGLPLRAFNLPWPCNNEQYQEIMSGACKLAMAEGVEFIAFGDLFLEDVRAYREQQLKPTGLTPLFPLWGIPTNELAGQMSQSGLRATITCVDPRQLGREFAGLEWSAARHNFPSVVDVCGERGEFHTFAYAGPMFSRNMSVETGQIVERDGFVFADVLTVVIRDALPKDAAMIAVLSEQLGYPVSIADIAERMKAYHGDSMRRILVAEFGDNIAGWIDVSIASHLVSGEFGEIAGLVVADGFRGRGIGTLLLEAAEKWIKAGGVEKCLVRSRSTRIDAHRFYEREKYTLEKTSAVFSKRL